MAIALPAPTGQLDEFGEPVAGDETLFYEIGEEPWKERPPMGAESDLIVANLIIKMGESVAAAGGLCFTGGGGYQIFPNKKLVRFPDASYMRPGRLPNNKPPRGWMKIPPDLVIEVVSPNDSAEDVEERLDDFLKVGVPLAWMLYPKTRSVHVYHAHPPALRPASGDVLTGEDVLPGFSIRVDEIFAAI